VPVQTDHLADEIKGLTDSVNDLRADFAGFKGSVEKELQLTRTLGKWILAAFTSIAIVALTGAGGLIWSAAVLSNEVKHQSVRLDKIELRLDKMDQRLDKMDQRFDRLDQQVIQLDKRMDKTDAKLDLILQRLDQAAAKAKAAN